MAYWMRLQMWMWLYLGGYGCGVEAVRTCGADWLPRARTHMSLSAARFSSVIRCFCALSGAGVLASELYNRSFEGSFDRSMIQYLIVTGITQAAVSVRACACARAPVRLCLRLPSRTACA
eukprot:2052861-Pleurochrysis_carterae.AAC.1